MSCTNAFVTIKLKNPAINGNKKTKIAYASVAGVTGFTVGFSTPTVFLPLNAENKAAAKQSMAAMMKAVVSAVMKGVAMALGKKVWLSRMFRVLCGNPAVIGPMP